MIPLTMAKPGETVTVRRITGKDDVRQQSPLSAVSPAA